VANHDRCVQSGTWLYEGKVPSRVEVWRRGVRPGTGDDEDEPEFRDDQVGEWYEVRYYPPGTIHGPSKASGGFYRDLQSAVASVQAATRQSVRWSDL